MDVLGFYFFVWNLMYFDNTFVKIIDTSKLYTTPSHWYIQVNVDNYNVSSSNMKCTYLSCKGYLHLWKCGEVNMVVGKVHHVQAFHLSLLLEDVFDFLPWNVSIELKDQVNVQIWLIPRNLILLQQNNQVKFVVIYFDLLVLQIFQLIDFPCPFRTFWCAIIRMSHGYVFMCYNTLFQLVICIKDVLTIFERNFVSQSQNGVKLYDKVGPISIEHSSTVIHNDNEMCTVHWDNIPCLKDPISLICLLH